MTVETRIAQPQAKVVPHVVEHLGHRLVDNYAWLQDQADPEVIGYLEAENAYARAAMQHTAALQEQLFHEMRGRIKEDDSTAPQQRGSYWYYSRVQEGKQYRIFCRKRGSLDAPEEILVDENALAAGHTYCRVAAVEPSPDHTLLAYTVDTTGARIFDLYVEDLATGTLMSGPIPQVSWTAAWASDGRTILYTVFDEAHRPYKLLRHVVGSDPADDVLVYHEPDEAFSLRMNRTRSGAYLLLTLWSQSTSEVYYLPADRPMDELQVLHPRQHWLEYYVEHHDDRFLIRTNDAAENFRLMETPVSNPARDNWHPIIPHRADTLLEGVDAFRDHLVMYERQGGLRRIRLSAPDGVSDIRYVSFPEPAYSVHTGPPWANANPEYDTNLLRFYYSSLVTPDSTVDYHVDSSAWEVVKQQEIPGGYDPTQYVMERQQACAPDGAQVPISLVYRRGLARDGRAPLLLEGYGAYGVSKEPAFDTSRLSLLDRGFVYALAHVRGGSELGRAWYEQGRLLQKKNSFADLIACAEQLVAHGYTTAAHLAIIGASAGGLLVAAATNMRPDLFRAVVALVPFTNVISAILQPNLPLTVTEYEQWGHPDDAQAFANMLSYSPYENVTAQAYPHIFVRAGLNDLQVPYWDPAKWVAKLRATKTDANRLLLVTNMGAGHGGASGRYDYLREQALVYAFLLDTLR